MHDATGSSSLKTDSLFGGSPAMKSIYFELDDAGVRTRLRGILGFRRWTHPGTDSPRPLYCADDSDCHRSRS